MCINSTSVNYRRVQVRYMFQPYVQNFLVKIKKVFGQHVIPTRSRKPLDKKKVLSCTLQVLFLLTLTVHTLIGIADDTLTEKLRANTRRDTSCKEEIRETRMILFKVFKLVVIRSKYQSIV